MKPQKSLWIVQIWFQMTYAFRNVYYVRLKLAQNTSFMYAVHFTSSFQFLCEFEELSGVGSNSCSFILHVYSIFHTVEGTLQVF